MLEKICENTSRNFQEMMANVEFQTEVIEQFVMQIKRAELTLDDLKHLNIDSETQNLIEDDTIYQDIVNRIPTFSKKTFLVVNSLC